MKNLRSRFERFCFANRYKGIPNLMLYIAAGTAVVYIIGQMTGNYTLYSLLCFHRESILHGQIWRLFTFPLVYGTGSSNLLLIAISLFCYWSLGRAMENTWGTFKFNLFYLTGMVLMDVWCLIFGGQADVTYLNLSMFLGYATMYPDTHFLLFFIIPVKAWIFALLNLGMVALDFFTSPFPYNFFSIISLANYFLFFGKDVVNVLPPSWRLRAKAGFRKQSPQRPKVIPFDAARSSKPAPQANYTHRCTVCGRTDVSNPELEFRYCSRCRGYYCYCQDHISNHSHIQ